MQLRNQKPRKQGQVANKVKQGVVTCQCSSEIAQGSIHT